MLLLIKLRCLGPTLSQGGTCGARPTVRWGLRSVGGHPPERTVRALPSTVLLLCARRREPPGGRVVSRAPALVL